MNVTDIVIKYLKDNGYDGLCGDGCGCGLDDFAPCDSNIGDCKPAYKVKSDCGNCENQCIFEGEADYCYKETKE